MKFMFCQKCGKNNEGTMNFCMSCGERLVDNQPAVQSLSFDSVIKRAKELPSKAKGLPKWVKRISVVALVLIVVGVVLNAIGTTITDPKNIVKGYFEAKANGDWDKMYSYLSLDESEFITKEKFLQMMESEEKTDFVNLEIIETNSAYNDPSFSNSGWVKIYTVRYMKKGEAGAREEFVTLVNKSQKKILFYDDYDINIDNLTTSNFRILASKDSAVYLDDIKLTRTEVSPDDDYYEPDNDSDTFIAPKLFLGQHDLKVEHSVFKTHEEKIQIDWENINNSYDANNRILTDEAKIGMAKRTEEIYKQLMDKAFEEIPFDGFKLSGVTDNEEKLDEIKEIYDYFSYTIKEDYKDQNKSITLDKFKDISSENELMKRSSYLCEMEIEYTETVTPKPPERKAGIYIVNATELHVRAEPDKKSESIEKLPSDSIIEIFEIQGEWGRVENGWIAMEFVIPEQSENEKPAQPQSVKKSCTVEFLYSYEYGALILRDIDSLGF